MQNHPIPSVTDPLQYRAIGIVRGIYKPQNDENFTRGTIIDSKGNEIDSVVLGRVITLIRNHVSLEKPHLWVVYPRCRNNQNLHLQITGIWEPSTLNKDLVNEDGVNETSSFKVHSDEDSGQTIISGMGELHLDILVDRLKREFRVEANIGKPQVAYREAIKNR